MVRNSNSTPAQSRSSSDAYARKAPQYFGGVRRDFVDLLSRDATPHVLEIGCGSGETGAAALAEGRCDRYFGVEIATAAADLAQTRLTEVIKGDVERLELPWPDGYFDAVLMSEVLEHLVDPWSAVQSVAAKLKPGAIVLASSPNVAQMKIVRELIADRWELTDTGVMDRTHLRWFTQNSYRSMFEDAGIRVDSLQPMGRPGRAGRLFNLLTLNRFKHLTMVQICIIGRKA
ncbi:class I SAM-dependent methyltransferase [Erythrobacter crassostreae]|uniref:Class I SAM-dependent methyltransferase n=1 Tax=Erythrobacter crassostreae TaxID=2828328 RepID=A0A9X1JLZ9_9SPHN|nr:class I SAM-dependent methyltransferase [Erythrobacter crassostrea]MBV7258278.1 class I SAM-dependent methyltransferase [Erythrobacter crassostrea]